MEGNVQLFEEVSLEQQPTQPMVVGRQRRSFRILRKSIVLFLCMLLLGGAIFVGIASAYNSLSLSPIINALIHTNTPSRPTPIPTSVPLHSTQVDQAVKHFMEAMRQKDWKTMWSMLHPDAQQSWQGESDFIHFEQTKFGAMQFSGYSSSSSRLEQAWHNRDTTLIYSNVVTLNVSLQLTAPKGLLTAPSNFALKHGLFDETLFALAQNQGTWQVLIAGPADLDAPILVPASPPVSKLVVPIFMYHHISNQPTSDLLDYNLTVTTTEFNRQLTWLQQHGYHSMSETELFDAFYYGKALPVHPMLLTFDDGYEDMYTDALPTLLAHHYIGIFYIITGLIGRRYMTWNQIRTLARDGMQIASHTIHHVNIGNPPARTSTQAELVLSRQTLEKQLDQPIQFFCYPVGEPFHYDTVAQQREVLTDLFNDGYVGATLDPFSLFSVVQNDQLPYQLNRVRVSGGEGINAFIGILNATLRSSRAGIAILRNTPYVWAVGLMVD